MSGKNGFTWPSTQSSSGTDCQSHQQTDAVDGVVAVHQREHPQQQQPEITSASLNVHHRSCCSRCHCCDSGGGSSSSSAQFEIDRLNERIAHIDQNIAAIFRLLTSSDAVGRIYDNGGASLAAAENRQTQETGRAAATSGGELKRSSSQSPSTMQRMAMSPLFMDTISETDEDSGVQHSLGVNQPRIARSRSADVASGTDRGREGGDDDGGRCGSNTSNDSKRLQIQHELEIL